MPYDEDTVSRARLLRVILKYLEIELEILFAPDELVYDKYTADFSDMVTHALELKALLEHNSKATNWSFDLGAVMALYFVASKCRIRSVRNRVLRALERGPRREGIWDNLLLRDVAEWLQGMEEEFVEGDIVPVWARMVDLQYSFDLEHRVVGLRFRQRPGQHLDDEARKTRIAW